MAPSISKIHTTLKRAGIFELIKNKCNLCVEAGLGGGGGDGELQYNCNGTLGSHGTSVVSLALIRANQCYLSKRKPKQSTGCEVTEISSKQLAETG